MSLCPCRIEMGAAAPTCVGAAPAEAPGRILYLRDKAGWNNVRITFESLVVAARLTGRQLVLPPPSRIDHLEETLFHELQVTQSAPCLHLSHHLSFLLWVDLF